MEIDNSPPRRDVTVRSRCGRSPVRSRLTSAWKLPGQPFCWSGHPSVTGVARNSVPSVPTGGVGIHPQSNAGLVENVAVGTGWNLLVRVRRVGGRSAVVRPPSLPGGRSPGSCVTRSYAARTAAPPAQQVFGRGGGASTGKLDIVDGAQLHRRSNCRGVVTTRVIHPASRRDTGEKGLSKHGDIP
jgi:hypothetical protein